MTKKMIEKYVILDMKGNLVEDREDMKTGALRVYNRELSGTIIKIDTGDANMDLHIAKACIDACEEFIPLEPEQSEGDDENSSD